MHPAIIAAACCLAAGVPPPFVQSWSDTGLITADDDWSHVPAMVGYRGDGLTSEPGTDPRSLVAAGSGTPVDVTANRTDPGAVGLAAGVAEFELANPVVAVQGSATAAAPHLVVALDTRGRAGIAVRLVLRDIDPSAADAAQAVALQYRAGSSGEFANAPGGYVADATTGPGEATAVTEVRTVLPPGADDQPLVELRVLTTNAAGRDEWVGVDDIEVWATSVAKAPACGAPLPAPPADPEPEPEPEPAPDHPDPAPLVLSGLTLKPDTFSPARRGPATALHGRAGAELRFRLSRAALVRFQVLPHGRPGRFPRTRPGDLHFRVRGGRGLNRMRFTGRVRRRPLAAGAYVLTAVAVDRTGRRSDRAFVRFRIRQSSRTSAPPGAKVARRISQSGASALRRSTMLPVCCQWHQNRTVGPAPEIVAPTAPSSSARSTSSIERG
jgi:hypothetical protein